MYTLTQLDQDGDATCERAGSNLGSNIITLTISGVKKYQKGLDRLVSSGSQVPNLVSPYVGGSATVFICIPSRKGHFPKSRGDVEDLVTQDEADQYLLCCFGHAQD